jgi:carboxymethylenebutenolidase
MESSDRHPDPYGHVFAAGPFADTEIHTPSDGLDTARVSLPAPDGEVAAYVARPDGVDGAPLVVVISEAFGVHEPIADIARRLPMRAFTRSLRT